MAQVTAFGFIYALEFDEFAKTAAEKKDRINAVEEIVDCKVCRKRHKKRNCSYKSRHCGMLGSHQSDKCFKAFPQLRQGRGDKTDREKDRSKSRSLSRGRKPRYGGRGKDDRQKPNTWRVGDRNQSESYRIENMTTNRIETEERGRQAGTELCQAQLKLASSLFCFRLAQLTELELD